MRYARVVSALIIPAALMGCGESDRDPFGPGDEPPPSNALTFEWTGDITAGDHLEIRGINGEIDATPAQGSQVEVFAQKRWERSNPDEVSFQVVRHTQGVTICAIYPNPLPGRQNECNPDGAGDTRVGDNDIRVDFQLRLPAGVDLKTSMVNGSLRTEELDGDVFAGTVNGELSIRTTGLATAATVNGNIFASFGASTWDRDLAFATVTGNIDLEVPDGTDADVNVITVNGSISSDFPLSIDSGFVGTTASGTLGQGGHDLDVAVVNGDVTIRRR